MSEEAEKPKPKLTLSLGAGKGAAIAPRGPKTVTVEVRKRRVIAKPGAAGIEDPDDDFFAKQRWQGADPKVNHPVGAHLELHAPVLGHALFGNVHARDDLDARGQLVLDGHGWRRDLAQLAVNAKTHAVGVLVRLEMQVGGPHAEGVQQHLVQELDNGRVFNIRRAGVCGFGGLLNRDVIKFEVAAGIATAGPEAWR